MNDVVRWIVGILIAAIVGSYTYTYKATSASEDRIFHRLDRLEDKIDRVLETK